MNQAVGGDEGQHPTIPFPFEPYDVQTQLMRKIYGTLDKGGIGVFESPTGTGKSLSVICSALQWLKDAEAKDINDNTVSSASSAGGNGKTATEDSTGEGDNSNGGSSSNSMPSWLRDYSKNKAQRERDSRAKRIREKRKELEERLTAVRKNVPGSAKNSNKTNAYVKGRTWTAAHGANQWGGVGAGRKRPRPKNATLEATSEGAKSTASGNGKGTKDGQPDDDVDDDGEFLVAEYESGGEKDGAGGGRESSSDEEGQEKGWGKGGEDERQWDDLGLRQILYCSRTHSQTSQFVNEVKKTAFAEGIRCASLGSRRNLCGNAKVSRLKSDARMNDACLELQKSKKEKNKKKTKTVTTNKRASKSGTPRKMSKSDENSKAKGGRTGGSGPSAYSGRYGENGEDDSGTEQEEDIEESTDGCPLLRSDGQKDFPFRALAKVHDIEELAELGKRDETCAYYGARKAAALAQLVVMPYAALLSRDTRDALGVRLEGAVVIVDEAHNIVEAINSVHSKKITLSELARAHSQLSQYEARYGTRLKGGNAFYVGNILRLLRALMKFLTKGKEKLQAIRMKAVANNKKNASTTASKQARLATARGGTLGRDGRVAGVGRGSGEEKVEEEEVRSEMLEINEILFRTGVDNVNIFKIQRYMRRSEIARKVMGFLDLSAASSPEVTVHSKPSATATADEGEQAGGGSGNKKDAAAVFVSKHISALQTVEGFLDALTNSNRDGRVLVTYGGVVDGSEKGSEKSRNLHKQQQQQKQEQKQQEVDEEPSLKFIMLNPSVHFDEIVQKARAIVLVGGTMQPTGDLVRQLFSSVEPSRVDVFSCGHVIPRENLLPLCVSRGPSGKTFNFTFHRRGTDEQVDELGRLMTNVCKLVPGGVVCFLASYGYLDQVLERWKASGTLRQLGRLKSVFCEPRSAKDVDVVLRDFSVAARAGGWKPSGGGGGGSGGGGLLLSVVGAKMSEGINFSDDLARCVAMVGLPYPDKRDPELQQKMAYLDKADPSSRGRAGREFYSSICMRAVNQSIGRSIRHAGDYSSILLVDERYRDDQVIRQLPGWIAERIVRPANFGGVFSGLRGFFTQMHGKSVDQNQ